MRKTKTLPKTGPKRAAALAMTTALAATLAAALAGYLLGGCASGLSSGSDKEEEPVQIPNPWRTCATLEDAAAIAGFTITVPDSACSRDITLIQAVEGSTIQVFYGEGEGRVLVRKARGTGDISGDYNAYPITQILCTDDVDITIKGSGDRYSTAVWTKDGFAYAILFGEPVITDTIFDLVWSVE